MTVLIHSGRVAILLTYVRFSKFITAIDYEKIRQSFKAVSYAVTSFKLIVISQNTERLVRLHTLQAGL